MVNGSREIIICPFRYECELELSATEANDLSRLIIFIFFGIYIAIMIVVVG